MTRSRSVPSTLTGNVDTGEVGRGVLNDSSCTFLNAFYLSQPKVIPVPRDQPIGLELRANLTIIFRREGLAECKPNRHCRNGKKETAQSFPKRFYGVKGASFNFVFYPANAIEVQRAC